MGEKPAAIFGPKITIIRVLEKKNVDGFLIKDIITATKSKKLRCRKAL